MHTRVIGGQGKRLVISDRVEAQDAIAQLLPVLDQPIAENDPDKIQMRMLMNAAQYLRQQKIALKAAGQAGSASRALPAAGAPAMAGGVGSFDKVSNAKPYASIYASDDAKLTQGARVLVEEAVFPSLSSLQLKGIFGSNSRSPLALLSCDNLNFTARDGGVFQNNRSRLKGVTSQIFKDRVVLTGPDRIPREIKFKSSL